MASLDLNIPRFAVFFLVFSCAALAVSESGKARKKSPESDFISENDLVENYQEIKEALKNIFAYGVYADDVPETRFIGNPWAEKRDGLRRSLHMEAEDRAIDAARDYTSYRSGIPSRSSYARHNTQGFHAGAEHATEYLNEWIVHVPGGPKIAATLARDLGYHFHGQVSQIWPFFSH